MKLIHTKKVGQYFFKLSLRDEQKRLTQRKMTQIFQSLEDMHLNNLKHRMDLILIKAFKGKGDVSYLQKFKRLHQEGMWIRH